ncbi:MAG: hypothetical protein AB1634_18095, partial [Thermodesulfobacteriota bacterium]
LGGPAMKSNSHDNRSWMAAVTFAEAGEWETARQLIPEPRRRVQLNWWQRLWAAVAMAEEGLASEATRLLEPGRSTPAGRSDLAEQLGLRGIHLAYGVLRVKA